MDTSAAQKALVFQEEAASPLAGLRVFDLTGELAVPAGRLLAGLGADVVRPEPPCGDGVR